MSYTIDGPLDDDRIPEPICNKCPSKMVGPPGPIPDANSSFCLDDLCLEKKHLQHFIELYNFNKS